MQTVSKHFLRSPFLTLSVLLYIAECVASQLSPYGGIPVSAEVSRNPMRLGGWPEYLSGETAKDRRLVVLVSNSQGYAKEFGEDKIYYSIIKERLKQSHPEVVFENWSCPGIRSADVDMLFLLATERRASIVVFVLGPNNIDMPSEVNLDFSNSDINLLAGNPFRWLRMRDAIFWENTEWGTLFMRSLLLYSHFARIRSLLHDRWSRAKPNPWGELVSSRWGERLRDKRREKKAERKNRLKTLGQNREVANQLMVFERLMDSLSRRASTTRTKYLWLWQPGLEVKEDYQDIDELRKWLLFSRGAEQVAARFGGSLVNLNHSLKSKWMFRKGGHFSLRGHRDMADALYPLITHELQ